MLAQPWKQGPPTGIKLASRCMVIEVEGEGNSFQKGTTVTSVLIETEAKLPVHILDLGEPRYVCSTVV